MGGAILRGLYQASEVVCQLTVVDVARPLLDKLKGEMPNITVSDDAATAVKGADIVLIAVKPWLVSTVVDGIRASLDLTHQVIVSIAAGVTFAQLSEMIAAPEGVAAKIVRVIPNTAIAVQESMTLIALSNISKEEECMVVDMFGALGMAMVIEERLMGAATALTSCGIAYVFRYIRAAMEGGVEMGIAPDKSLAMVLQTMQGAVSLLEVNGSHPEAEIDKVTTPGGITIKGLNEMEHAGFTSAVIRGLKASNV